MEFRKSRNLMWLGFAVGLLIIALGRAFDNTSVNLVFMIAGTLVFFTALIQAFIFYKCPHCGYSLMNVKGDVPKHCPKCGKML